MTTRGLQPLVGQGLLTSEGELWKRQRKLAAQPFAPKRLDVYENTMVDCATRAFAQFADGEVRDFHHDSMLLTLEIAGKALLGVQTPQEVARVGESVTAALSYFHERMRTWKALLPPSFPTQKLLKFRRGKRDLDAVVKAIITRCRNDGAQGDYLLARLLRARTDDGQEMPEQLLLDEAVTMLLAGHETTALSLMFAVYLLSAHPVEAARLRTDIDNVLQGRPIEVEDLKQLPFLDAVIREALRMYPPAYAFGRETTAAFELGGYKIPVGAQVAVSPYGMHRNARFFREPDRFRPERWINGETEDLPRFAYLPFGGGHRICIGSHFALLEIAVALASLVQQVELTVVPGFELKLDPVITLRSENGLPVRVKRRINASRGSRRSETPPASTPSASGAGCPHAAASRPS
jgi:cytochrome P450